MIEYPRSKIVGLFLGPILMAIILALPSPSGITPEGWKVFSIMVLMIIWWVTESVPVPVTSLVPIALFPLFGIFSIKEVVVPYANPAIFLFLGGFIIAAAVEKWNLHKRIALTIVSFTGTNASGVVGGFVLAAGFLSMWMSNTATVVMMMPIGVSVIDLFVKGNEDNKSFKNFAASLMLAITYAASIGGIATIIGTPTNGVFVGFMKEAYGFEVSFMQWSIIAMPIVVIFLFLSWWVLVKLIFPCELGDMQGSAKRIKEELLELGSMKKGEKLVAIVFCSAAFFWIARNGIQKIFSGTQISDQSIAILAAISLFLIPVNLSKGKFLLDWGTAKKLPWGILLLFGGGLSLAYGLEKTGLVSYVAEVMSQMQGVTPIILIIVVSVVISIATTFIGNMTLASIAIPIMSSMAIGFGINPIVAAVPVTIAASCSFMLPVSTPPNAIIYASEHVSMKHMIKAGFVMNIIGVILITIFTYYLSEIAFDMDLSIMPEWVTRVP